MSRRWTRYLALAFALLLLSCAKPQTEPVPSPDPVREGWTYVPPENGPYEGCARNLADGLTVEGGFLYFDGGVGEYTVPTRLNLATGNVTAVCSDPLCAHDSPECPLYGIYHFLPLKDLSILAVQQYSVTEMTAVGQVIAEHVNRFIRYVPEERKRIILEELGSQGGYGPEVILGNYRFYLSQIYNEEGEWIGGLSRMDLDTGNTEMLFEGYYDLLFHKDGRVWVSDGVGFFSFEADHPAPVLRSEFVGTSAMLPEYSRFSTDGTNLYITQHLNKTVRVLPIDGSGEYSLTLDFADYWYLLYPVGGWIYYFSGETAVIGDARIRGYASDKVELYGEEFRRCRSDGSEDQCVFRFEGEWASYRPLHIASDGRYLYCDYSWWEDPDGDGVYRDGDNCYSFPVNGHDNCALLRIDGETGEVMRIVIREGTK